MTGIPPGSDRRDPERVDRRSSPALKGHLELLAKMSGHLAVTLNIDDTIHKALELIVGYVNAEAGSLFLLDENGTELICKASVGPVDILEVEILATDPERMQVTRSFGRTVIRGEHDEGPIEPHPLIDKLQQVGKRLVQPAQVVLGF